MASPASTNTVSLNAILLGLLAASTLSLLSGFQNFPVPFDLAWQFSPLGVLQGISPENAAIESASYFSGRFGLTPDYFIYFLKTCAYESPFYYLCFRGLPFPRILALIVLLNLATHPIVFFVIPLLFSRYFAAALFSEAFAPTIEVALAYLVLRRAMPGETRAKVAARASWLLIANLFSWEAGMFL